MRQFAAGTLGLMGFVLAVGCTGNAPGSRQGDGPAAQPSGSDTNSFVPADSPAGTTVTTASGAGGTNVNGLFVPLSIEAQAAKVKNVLTSLPLNTNELALAKTVGIAPLVAGWTQTPEYQTKIQSFLGVALQQAKVQTGSFLYSKVFIGPFDLTDMSSALLLSNLQESMARTVLNNEAQGRPFSQTMTTHSFMMTVPMMVYYAFVDVYSLNDNGSESVPFPYFVSNVLRDALAKFTEQDYHAWREVTVVQPGPGQAITSYTDANMGAKNTLTLRVPRTGFMTTPAFFAQWQTSLSNQARVSINQTLVVALGRVVDGSTRTPPASLGALDQAHAVPGTACYGCHLTMDPLKQYFRQTYSVFGAPQKDPNMLALPGQFDIGPVNLAGGNFNDFAARLAAHPDMPLAWAQKVCSYGTDGLCLRDDPELVRIANRFAAHQSFHSLVQDVFSSPLVTYASATATSTQTGVVASVSKKDHLCSLLSSRLGMTDACGLAYTNKAQLSLFAINAIVPVLPSNEFSRGDVNPVQINDPTLFYRGGIENLCSTLSAQVVDAPAQVSFSSKDPNGAIASLVHNFMGIAAEMDATPISVMQQHFQKALASGATAAQAMSSTFVLACTSPAIVGMGR